ncbi:MAG: radical SAM protein [Proteobacteria bacterium]|nr:radical SAM protein [Pseudomonadota bacterium]
MARLNLADWVDCTEVEGPGKRLALWVQGCLLRCPECCNAHMLEIVPRNVVGTDVVLEWINDAKNLHSIEGVTFLGGEPMLQARGLSEIARGCQDIELSVMTFTGYPLDDLNQNPMPGVSDLLIHTDILVDGPFVLENPERTRNWAGSINQQFHFLSERYKAGIEFDPAYSRGFELRIFDDGRVRTNGWPLGSINRVWTR